MATNVIIVGAGAAGLAAASRLCERGFAPSQIIILEAENRIGGRVHTIQHGDGVIEMGAQWVHGEKDNVVYQLASSAGELRTDIQTLESTGYGDNVEIAYPRQGRKISPKQWTEFLEVTDSIYDSVETELAGSALSLGEYFLQKYREHLNRGSLNTLDQATAWDLLDWTHRSQNIHTGSPNWLHTNGEGYLQYEECEGDETVVWKRGYSALFPLLMKNVPSKNENGQQLPIQDRIHLNSPVTKISWNSDRVKVECGEQTYEADVVLVTCSLGVLKEQADRLFSPTLPEKKRQAIAGLGFGTVNKIYLKFQRPWWTRKWGGVNFLYTESDRVGDWKDNLLGFFTLRDQPNLLEGWLSGNATCQTERIPEDELLRKCAELLRGAVGKDFDAYEDPVSLIRTKWYSNPHFRGSYSFRSNESKQRDVWASDLAQPVLDSTGRTKLLFAGEATHDHHFSTVHGAVATGWREADRILSLQGPSNSTTSIL